MKIGIKLRESDPIWTTYVEQLKEFADIEIIYDYQTIKKREDIEVLITSHLNDETLSKFPNLKAIFLFKTGTDGLPLKTIKERNIYLWSSHANADIIAEHAIALSLSLIHRIPEFHNDLKDGTWYSNGKNYMWRSISDMKVGILGYGHIGESIFDKLVGFKCEIWAYNRSHQYAEGIIGARDMMDLIKNCDLIYVCLPKTDETCSIINHTVLQNMKDKYIVNVGRAEICEEKALYEALCSGALAGYASDVWYMSPDKVHKDKKVLPSNYSFEKNKNVVMSPHCATHVLYAHERYIKDAVESCIKYLKRYKKF